MSEDVKMSVSAPVVKDERKIVYVVFEDVAQSAEFEAPAGTLVKNSGFSEEDVEVLQEYIKNNWKTIFDMAKDIDPMKAFLF